jgi:hypothetical protein
MGSSPIKGRLDPPTWDEAQVAISMESLILAQDERWRRA